MGTFAAFNRFVRVGSSPSRTLRDLGQKDLLKFLMLSLAFSLAACDKSNGVIHGSIFEASLADCPINAVSTSPCKVPQSGVGVSTTLGGNVTSWSNVGASSTIQASIPDGFYSNKSITFTDSNLVAANILNGVSIFGVAGTASSSSYPACTDNTLNGGQCTTASNRYVASVSGSNVSGSNGNLTAIIPQGFYDGTKTCTMSDTSLVATNIKSGVSIFGTTGSLTPAYGACTDNALNAGQCSTSANRYVTATNGANVSGANGNLAATIPQGFYNGTKTCTMSDTSLVATNIKSGVSIFGTTGSLTPAYSACTDDALNVGQCSTAINRFVTSTSGANVSGANASLSATIPRGYYDGTKTASMSDSNLLASNVASGVSIFGTIGNYIGSFDQNMASNASRDPGQPPVPNNADLQTTSSQITLRAENSTYSNGANLPSSGGYLYRDIPSDTRDDNGSLGTTCKYTPRPTNNCGLTQNTVAARIADCATANPSASSWDGSVQCNRGQGLWKLVSRSGANKEVWQDQRTGLLWSSYVSTSINWCQASGATSGTPLTYTNAYNNTAGTPMIGTGTIGSLSGGSSSSIETIIITFTSPTTFTVSGTYCGGGSISSGGLTTTPGSTVTWSRANYCSFVITQGSVSFAVNDKFAIDSAPSSVSCIPGAGSGLQPASPISYCAEAVGLNAPAGENWGSGIYMAAKGGMGKNSAPSIRWRLPTIEDFELADVNGIRFVMPDAGSAGVNRPIPDTSSGAISSSGTWSATVRASARVYVRIFDGSEGLISLYQRATGSLPARCVGR